MVWFGFRKIKRLQKYATVAQIYGTLVRMLAENSDSEYFAKSDMSERYIYIYFEMIILYSLLNYSTFLVTLVV
jgi:hypothetical protein